MRAISLPFRLDGYGSVAATTDQTKIWADRVKSVVATRLGERVMRPTFGCRMPDNLFDAMSSVPEIVEGDITAAFETWLPDLRFDGLDVSYEDEANGLIEVNVGYVVPQIQQNENSPRYSIVV